MDMLDLWRGLITPRQMLNLIDRLPQGSHFQAAIADDDDLAEAMGEEAASGPPPPPPLNEWSGDRAMLTVIADRLGDLLTATVQANSTKKVPQNRPLPRPETAMHRQARRRRDAKRALLSDRLAAARAAGRPTMSEVTADPTHATKALKRRRK